MLPALTPAAKPVALIVATPGLEEVQVTDVSGFRLPSEKVPVAENGRVSPLLIVFPAGEIEMEANCGSADVLPAEVLPEHPARDTETAKSDKMTMLGT